MTEEKKAVGTRHDRLNEIHNTLYVRIEHNIKIFLQAKGSSAKDSAIDAGYRTSSYSRTGAMPRARPALLTSTSTSRMSAGIPATKDLKVNTCLGKKQCVDRATRSDQSMINSTYFTLSCFVTSRAPKCTFTSGCCFLMSAASDSSRSTRRAPSTY